MERILNECYPIFIVGYVIIPIHGITIKTTYVFSKESNTENLIHLPKP